MTFKTLTLTAASIATVLAVTFTLTASDQILSVSHPVAQKINTSSIQNTYLTAHVALELAGSSASSRTASAIAAGVSTATLTTLMANISKAEAELNELLPNEAVVEPKLHITSGIKVYTAPRRYISITGLTYQSALVRADLTAYVTRDRIAGLNRDLTAWESELANEKARIAQAAENARLAAQADAQAAQSRRGVSGHHATASPAAPGSAQDRINRILASLPLSFNGGVQVGYCSIPSAGACTTGDRATGWSHTVVTALGLTYSDCKLRMVLAHENRHQQQFRAHQILPNNQAWAEADANAFMRAYGC